jgi:cytidylate kinase
MSRIGHDRPASDHLRVIAIDGPAAAGKTTVAGRLANRLGALLFDTGALYRAVALAVLRSGVSLDDEQGLARIAQQAKIHVRPPTHADGRQYDVLLDGEDVTWEVRDPAVGAVVSRVAERQEVRAALLPMQRRIAAGEPVVMVGRDIGTVVVPDAGLKIFLDATPEERAKRRLRESMARGTASTFGDVLSETRQRDELDASRKFAPLALAPDAIRINTDDLSIDEVVDRIEALARRQKSPNGEPIWSPR